MNNISIYIFISKSKLQEKSHGEWWDQDVIKELNISKFNQTHFDKVFENKDTIIFKFKNINN